MFLRDRRRHELAAPSTPTPSDTDPRRFAEYHEAARPRPSEVPSPQDLRDFARQLAISDAASGMYADAHLTAHEKCLLAEQRLWTTIQALRSLLDDRRRESIAIGSFLAGVARAEQTWLEAEIVRLERDRNALRAARDAHLAVLEGKTPDAQDGDWTDGGMTTTAALRTVAEVEAETRRLRRRRTWTYAALVMGDAVALYMATYQIMTFPSAIPTMASDGLVILPTILICAAMVGLGHIIGVHIKTARRLPAGRSPHVAIAVGAAALLVGAQWILASLRTTDTVDGYQDASRALWFLVTLALGLIAAWVAARGHNPHAVPMAIAHRSALAADDELTALRAREPEIKASVDQRQESATSVPDHWAARVADLDLEWKNLVAIYRHELARQLADPSVTTALESAPIVRPVVPSAEAERHLRSAA